MVSTPPPPSVTITNTCYQWWTELWRIHEYLYLRIAVAISSSLHASCTNIILELTWATLKRDVQLLCASQMHRNLVSNWLRKPRVSSPNINRILPSKRLLCYTPLPIRSLLQCIIRYLRRSLRIRLDIPRFWYKAMTKSPIHLDEFFLESFIIQSMEFRRWRGGLKDPGESERLLRGWDASSAGWVAWLIKGTQKKASLWKRWSKGL